MDFEIPYSEEQERFRQEVRAFLKEVVPEDLKDPVDARRYNMDLDKRWQEVHKVIGAKGWFYPTFSKGLGGAGLTGDHETIIVEEFRRAGVPSNFTSANTVPPLVVWTNDEQKRKFLFPIVTAEKTCWNKLTEPQSGADLANVKNRAVRDGDDWLLSGRNVLVSGRGQPGFLFGPFCTDPDAPRHRNLGYFIIPVNGWDPVTGATGQPGLVMKEQSLIGGHNQHAIFMDNVRVPGDHLVGGDHQGWQVASTTMESEHGGRGQAFPDNEVVDNLLGYAKDTKQDGTPLIDDPVFQQTTMTAYIDDHISGLLKKRVFWMYQNKMEMNGEPNWADVQDRGSDLRNPARVREVMGMYSLLNQEDSRAPHGGSQEANQRETAGQRHPGGTNNIARVIVARRIGISRTRERAAPTPSTATTGGA